MSNKPLDEPPSPRPVANSVSSQGPGSLDLPSEDDDIASPGARQRVESVLSVPRSTRGHTQYEGSVSASSRDPRRRNLEISVTGEEEALESSEELWFARFQGFVENKNATGVGVSSWKKRWWVVSLADRAISYYKNPGEKLPIGFISLKDVIYCELAKSKDNRRFDLVLAKKVYGLRTDSQEMSQRWVVAVNQCIDAIRKTEMHKQRRVATPKTPAGMKAAAHQDQAKSSFSTQPPGRWCHQFFASNFSAATMSMLNLPLPEPKSAPALASRNNSGSIGSRSPSAQPGLSSQQDRGFFKGDHEISRSGISSGIVSGLENLPPHRGESPLLHRHDSPPDTTTTTTTTHTTTTAHHQDLSPSSPQPLEVVVEDLSKKKPEELSDEERLALAIRTRVFSTFPSEVEVQRACLTMLLHPWVGEQEQMPDHELGGGEVLSLSIDEGPVRERAFTFEAPGEDGNVNSPSIEARKRHLELATKLRGLEDLCVIEPEGLIISFKERMWKRLASGDFIESLEQEDYWSKDLCLPLCWVALQARNHGVANDDDDEPSFASSAYNVAHWQKVFKQRQQAGGDKKAEKKKEKTAPTKKKDTDGSPSSNPIADQDVVNEIMKCFKRRFEAGAQGSFNFLTYDLAPCFAHHSTEFFKKLEVQDEFFVMNNPTHWRERYVSGCGGCQKSQLQFYQLVQKAFRSSELDLVVNVVNTNTITAMMMMPCAKFDLLLGGSNVPGAVDVHTDSFQVFNKPIHNGGLWKSLLAMLCEANPHVKRHALKDVTSLLVPSQRNRISLLNMPGWQINLFSLVKDLPREFSKDRLYEKLFQYAMFAFATLHIHLLVDPLVPNNIDFPSALFSNLGSAMRLVTSATTQAPSQTGAHAHYGASSSSSSGSSSSSSSSSHSSAAHGSASPSSLPPAPGKSYLVPRTMLMSLINKMTADSKDGRLQKALPGKWDYFLFFLQCVKEYLFAVPDTTQMADSTLLKGLEFDAATIALAERIATPIHLEEGQLLFEAGDGSKNMYIVREGAVQAVIFNKSQQTVSGAPASTISGLVHSTSMMQSPTSPLSQSSNSGGGGGSGAYAPRTPVSSNGSSPSQLLAMRAQGAQTQIVSPSAAAAGGHDPANIVVLAEFGSGDFLGEIGLLLDIPPTASVVCSRAGTKVLQLDRTNYEKFLDVLGKEAEDFIMKTVRERLVQNFRRHPGSLLSPDNVPTIETYSQIAQLCDLLVVPPSADIFKQGDVSANFYLIAYGTVRITVGDTEVRRLGPGSYFGELSREVKSRTATVSTLPEGKVVLLTMERKKFEEFLALCPGCRSALEQRQQQYTALNQFKSLLKSPFRNTAATHKEVEKVVPKANFRTSLGVHIGEEDGLGEDIKLVESLLQLMRGLSLYKQIDVSHLNSTNKTNLKNEISKTYKAGENIMVKKAQQEFEVQFGSLTLSDQKAVKVIQMELIPFFQETITFFSMLQTRITLFNKPEDEAKLRDLVEDFLRAEDAKKVFLKIKGF